VGYGPEINKVLNAIIDEEAPFYRELEFGEYRREELTHAVDGRFAAEHPDLSEAFANVTRFEGILGKVSKRLHSPKTKMREKTDDSNGMVEEDFRPRLNLNIPVPGQQKGATKNVMDCTLREVMLDITKREKKIAEDQAAVAQERRIVRSMLESGAELDEFVRDYFVLAA
jgi:hypothetical protein